MKQLKTLTEYKIQINNDEDFEKWKSTWTPEDPVPDEVMNYYHTVIKPKITQLFTDMNDKINRIRGTRNKINNE